MEVSSELLLSNGCTSRQRVLLTASLFTCWLLSTTAKVTIHSPLQVVEGQNVFLRVDNLPEDLLAFAWYRGLRNWRVAIALHLVEYNASMTGPEHSDREILHSNGSLWIQNVTQEDTGYYTLQTISKHGKLVSNTSTFLQVYSALFTCGRPTSPAKLTIESVPPRVAEGGSVLLLVHNLPEYSQLFSWYKGLTLFNEVEIAEYKIAKNLSDPGPAHSGREIVFSNGSLLLQNVTWKDTGFYTLQTVNGFREMELAHIYLRVDTPCCDPPDSARLRIDPVTCHAAEGGSVLLQVHNLPEDVQTFSWYKGVDSTPYFRIVEYSKAMKSIFSGYAHSRRETGYTNGSLLLQDVTEKDTGFYTLLTIDSHVKVETVHAQVNVHRSTLQGIEDKGQLRILCCKGHIVRTQQGQSCGELLLPQGAEMIISLVFDPISDSPQQNPGKVLPGQRLSSEGGRLQSSWAVLEQMLFSTEGGQCSCCNHVGPLCTSLQCRGIVFRSLVRRAVPHCVGGGELRDLLESPKAEG